MPVFLDTAYFVGLLLPGDQLRETVKTQAALTEDEPKVTSDAVIVEVLAFMSRRGSFMRQRSIALVHRLREDPLVVIVRKTPELFDAALAFYEARPDKSYSLTDCMSMLICKARGITRVLTHDRHFAQEGLEVLL